MYMVWGRSVAGAVWILQGGGCRGPAVSALPAASGIDVCRCDVVGCGASGTVAAVHGHRHYECGGHVQENK